MSRKAATSNIPLKSNIDKNSKVLYWLVMDLGLTGRAGELRRERHLHTIPIALSQVLLSLQVSPSVHSPRVF
jgi:hypothetical protein